MQKTFRRLPLLLGCLLTLAGPGWASENQQILGFAEQLFAEQDYYRAMTEYKRYLHLEPATPEAPFATLRIAECLLAGERWQDAETILQRTVSVYPHTAEANQAALLQPEIAYRQQRYSLAGQQFRQLAASGETPRVRELARYRLAWTAIEQRDFTTAIRELNQLDASQADSLAAFEAFDNDNEVLGGILCLFEIGLYGGNIYNAVNHAHRHNQKLYDEEKRELQDRYGIQSNLGPATGLLEFHGRF